ncbi:MAG TPA: beta-Ala-His dipeptidase [Candidatus Sumerlaeota bacterium]|nr:beta-Ala-His dipeptidase [Candidatus Sumerlaeota bacterium]HOR29418.1 beta-Ala-His dipeptidase [Candidatus Sumerlaeota bacterium]HPK01112.1 beta-Ala-His dipeptidase [Candidatus Sumerlaeota bacterium]
MPASSDRVLKHFQAISRIPRPSGREEAVMRMLEDWAGGHGFAVRRDARGNRVIAVPASPGMAARATVVLQGHVDMVCEKTPESAQNFLTDPISLRQERDEDGEEWLSATDTTLGADNGIAVAMMMALAEDPAAIHPPLELLLTVEEETGLIGAGALEPSIVSGRILLNLDSEEEGVFTIGCAGGRSTSIRLPLAREAEPGPGELYALRVGGLRGGHSGVDIHLGRANALKLLAEAWSALAGAAPARLVSVDGGSADNAIPRDARAVVRLVADRLNDARHVIATQQERMRREYGDRDPETTLSLEPVSQEVTGHPLTADCAERLRVLLGELPHGPQTMSREFAEVVETSCNLARVETRPDALRIITSQRSSSREDMQSLTERIHRLARSAGAEAADDGRGYPPWPPRRDAWLNGLCREVWRELSGAEPEINVIHAGLECGVIGDRIAGMEMISLGPTIRDPHSPRERVSLGSVGRTYDFLVKLLARLAQG